MILAVIGRLALLLDPHWTGDPRPSQATVPVRVLAEVLLVVVLSVVERLPLRDLCCYRTKSFLRQSLRKTDVKMKREINGEKERSRHIIYEWKRAVFLHSRTRHEASY